MRKRLYRKLTNELQRQSSRASKPQVKNLALLTRALVFREDCHLPKLALQLPIAERRDSSIQRLRRFLDNCRVGSTDPLFALTSGSLRSLAGSRSQLSDGPNGHRG